MWGGRRTYMFSMVCFWKEDGSTLSVPWLGAASNWSHSRLWLLHQPLGLREHVKYLNQRQNRAFQISSESSNIAQNCLYLACLCFCCPCRTEEGDPAWFLHAVFYSRGHELLWSEGQYLLGLFCKIFVSKGLMVKCLGHVLLAKVWMMDTGQGLVVNN